MSELTHTKKPWNYNKGDDYVSGFHGSPNVRVVARKPEGTLTRWRDDATLISAAPDLLEALTAMADYYGHDLVNGDFQTEAANMRAALAAIDKATGVK